MKKLMRVLIAAILVMFLGCSKSSDSPTSPSTSSPVAGTWKLSTDNGVVPSGYTVTVVVNSNGNWSYTSAGLTSSTGTACTGSGTSSTSGNNLTTVATADNCPSTGKTVPYTETWTYTATTLTKTDTSGTVFTKQ